MCVHVNTGVYTFCLRVLICYKFGEDRELRWSCSLPYLQAGHIQVAQQAFGGLIQIIFMAALHLLMTLWSVHIQTHILYFQAAACHLPWDGLFWCKTVWSLQTVQLPFYRNAWEGRGSSLKNCFPSQVQPQSLSTLLPDPYCKELHLFWFKKNNGQ